MKKFVKLLPALVMLLISAILVSTTTYAWFSMNSQVTATNMKVKAVAEQGIVIADSDKTVWTDIRNSKLNANIAELLPTSTAGTTTPAWVHATSPNADDANPELYLHSTQGVPYEDLTLAWSATDSESKPEGLGYVDVTGGTAGQWDAGDRTFVRKDNFYIRAASTDLTANLYIKSLTVDVTSNATGSQTQSTALDKSLRVLVILTENNGAGTKHAFLYAPITGFDGEYQFKNMTDVSASAASPNLLPGGTNINTDTGITSIPNAASSAILVEVYTFFEGEDLNLKSANAGQTIAMDTLSSTIVFSTVSEGTAAPVTADPNSAVIPTTPVPDATP